MSTVVGPFSPPVDSAQGAASISAILLPFAWGVIALYVALFPPSSNSPYLGSQKCHLFCQESFATPLARANHRFSRYFPPWSDRAEIRGARSVGTDRFFCSRRISLSPLRDYAFPPRYTTIFRFTDFGTTWFALGRHRHHFARIALFFFALFSFCLY